MKSHSTIMISNKIELHIWAWQFSLSVYDFIIVTRSQDKVSITLLNLKCRSYSSTVGRGKKNLISGEEFTMSALLQWLSVYVSLPNTRFEVTRGSSARKERRVTYLHLLGNPYSQFYKTEDTMMAYTSPLCKTIFNQKVFLIFFFSYWCFSSFVE